uniref:hypothetical protein n=1 Tax=Falsiroseomonas oryzae TaxID=2766473 RepID=UPI0038CC0D75
ELPAALGRADTAHRALRRAAAARLLHRLLLRVSPHPLMRDSGLHGIAWFIVRAFRRAFRVASGAIAFARRLGLASALPCAPCWLPQAHLSETVQRIAQGLRAMTSPRPPALLEALHYLFRRTVGEPRMWRTTG